jgi:hypothetical protein
MGRGIVSEHEPTDEEKEYLRAIAPAKEAYEAAMAKAHARLEDAVLPIRRKYNTLLQPIKEDLWVARSNQDGRKVAFLKRKIAAVLSVATKEITPLEAAYRREVAPIKEEYEEATRTARLRLQTAQSKSGPHTASPSELAERRQRER